MKCKGCATTIAPDRIIEEKAGWHMRCLLNWTERQAKAIGEKNLAIEELQKDLARSKSALEMAARELADAVRYRQLPQAAPRYQPSGPRGEIPQIPGAPPPALKCLNCKAADATRPGRLCETCFRGKNPAEAKKEEEKKIDRFSLLELD